MAENFQWSNNHDVSNQNTAKRNNFPLLAITSAIVIAFALPVTVFVLQKQQQTQQHAAVSPDAAFGQKHDTCNKLTINVAESPLCPRLTQSTDGNNTCTVPDKTKKNTNISDYTFTVNISSNDGKQHTLSYHDFTNFCTHGYGDLFGSTKDCHCNDNHQSSGQKTLTISSSGSQTVTLHRTPTSGFANCGAYQFDLYIDSIDNSTSCKYPTNQLGTEGAVGHCDTGVDCTVVQSSPTPTIPPSITPTPTPSSICQANQSVCQWQADGSAVSYHYKVTDTAAGIVSQGDVNAPQTSVSFPSQPGHSYTCLVTGANACGTGTAGSATFVCNVTPTPTACPAPRTPPNVRISCPNCGS